MIVKSAISDCVILYADKMTLDEILANDENRLCTGNVDQYVVDGCMRMVGMISSDAAALMREDGNIEPHIVRNPIKIMTSRWERTMAESVIGASQKIMSIPVVDEHNTLLYVYRRVNAVQERFFKETEIKPAWDYASGIWEGIVYVREQMKKRVHVVSDVLECGGELTAEVKDYVIDIPLIQTLEPRLDLVLLACLYDFNAAPAVEACIKNNIPFLTCNIMRKDIILDATAYYRMDRAALEALKHEAAFHANYFDLNDFQNIFQAVRLTRNLPGAYVEIGTYRGDSARAALSYMRRTNIRRASWLIDTYEGFTYPDAERSQDCLWGGTHTDTSMDFVRRRVSEYAKDGDVRLVQLNIIENELPDDIKEIAVCNIDVDMYEAVAAALEKVAARVVKGGVIIAEDYGHTPTLIGAQYAVSSFYEKHPEDFYGLYMQSGQFIMIRK